MRLAGIIVAALLVTACEKPRYAKMMTPPSGFLRFGDQVKAFLRVNGVPGPTPCADISNEQRDDRCYRFGESKRWKGLWRNQFEGSRFCPGPARQCSDNSPGDTIWLDAGRSPDQTLYAVDFIGRKTAVKGSYGHFGMSDQEIIVDRMISMKQVEPPPPGPTRAQVIARFKKCEAAKTCIPNWQVINSMEE